jgi:hypothetical protein
VLKKSLLLWMGVSILSSTVYATSPYGVNFSYVLVNKDPNHLHAYRASFLYEPPSWVWEHVHIFFDAGYGHWWVDNVSAYSNLNIYSIAPVLRYYFVNSDLFSPFFDISIGPAYLTKTHIADRNLGMHFAFQDQVGLGASFGRGKHFTASLTALHYSNGSMSAMNAGITVPIMLNLSYRF